MKRAFPAYCPGQEWEGLSKADGIAHYAAMGYQPFDGEDGWVTMHNGVFEAFVRRKNALIWVGSVSQLFPCPIGDCSNQGTAGAEPCYRVECGQVNSGVVCDMPRLGNERICPDCNPRAVGP